MARDHGGRNAGWALNPRGPDLSRAQNVVTGVTSSSHGPTGRLVSGFGAQVA